MQKKTSKSKNQVSTKIASTVYHSELPPQWVRRPPSFQGAFTMKSYQEPVPKLQHTTLTVLLPKAVAPNVSDTKMG